MTEVGASEQTAALLGEMKMETTEYKAYSYRWLILTIFCSLEMTNNILWVTYAPISDIVSNYFGGGYYGSTTSVNMLANIFLILYLPGTGLSILLMKYFNLKRALEVCAFLTMFGALLRYIAAACRNDWGNENTYIVMLLGQAFAAMGQPMFLNSPPAVASIWFPTSEREMATTIGSMCAPIGSAIGQIIPFILVTQTSVNADDDDNFHVDGMTNLMLVEFILCCVSTGATVLFFRDAPPTAPSQSTHRKNESAKEVNEASASAGLSDWQRALDSFYKELKVLMSNKDYVLLLLSFSIGVGFFNALLTLLNQLVNPFGYSNDDAGTFGAVFIVFGLVGAGCVGALMEKTKAYRTLLKAGVTVCVFVLALFLTMLYSNNFWPLLISIGLLGFFMLPLLPLMMENCAECTYPVPEDISMGLMFAASNILGLGFIFALQYLIEEPAVGPPPFLPSNFFILGVLMVAFVILQFYNGAYNRMANEARKLSHALDAESGTLGNPLIAGSAGAALLGAASPTPVKMDASLVRVTSLDSGGSGNGSNGVVIGELSVANSSINMWHNSTVRNSSFSESNPSSRLSAAAAAQPLPARSGANTLHSLVHAHGKGRPPSANNLTEQDKPSVYREQSP